MLAGVISAEEASDKLWRLADLAPDWPDERLRYFKDLAIHRDFHIEPADCDCGLDPDRWWHEMFALADDVLAHGPDGT